MTEARAAGSSPLGLWERVAPLYDLQLFLERPSLRAAVGLASPSDGERVLDLGTGTGAMLRELARSGAVFAEVVGVDASEEMLARARSARLPREWALERGDARALRYEDKRFDLVLAAYLLNVLSDGDAEAVLREARRVLDPNGRLVVVSPVAPRSAFARPYHWLARLLERRLPSLFRGIRLLDPEPLLRRAGVVPRRGRYVGRGYPSLCILAVPKA